MSLIKGMENLDDFQKKYGNIYDEIFKRGQAAVKSNAPAATEFEQMVQENLNQGLSRSKAIRKAVSENPDAHLDYLNSSKTNKGLKLQAKPSTSFQRFEDAVAHFLSHGQESKASAIRATISQYPELHADYIARLKRGEQGVLLCRS